MGAFADPNMMQPNDDAVRGYRDQYGNGAFDQYMQEESRRGEDSQYGDEQEEDEAPLAIEYKH